MKVRICYEGWWRDEVLPIVPRIGDAIILHDLCWDVKVVLIDTTQAVPIELGVDLGDPTCPSDYDMVFNHGWKTQEDNDA